MYWIINFYFLNVLKMMMYGLWFMSSGVSWNGKIFLFLVSKGSLSFIVQRVDVKYFGIVYFIGVGGRMDFIFVDFEIVVNNGDDYVIMFVKFKIMVGQLVDYGCIIFVDMIGFIMQG